MLRAIEVETRRMLVISDNKYVVDTLNVLIAGGSATGAHQDLWQRIATILLQCPNRVRVQKTKGHAKQMHIRMGLSSELDHRNNECADALAENGAMQNIPPPAVVAEVLSSRKLLSKLQGMLMKIVEARENAGIVQKLVDDHEQAKQRLRALAGRRRAG